MKNYVKETEITKRKKELFFIRSTFGTLFFVGYTMFTLTEHWLLSSILCLLSIPIYMIITFPAIEDAREEKVATKKTFLGKEVIKFEKLREGNRDNKKKKGIIFLKLPFRDIVLHSIFRNYFDRAYIPP